MAEVFGLDRDGIKRTAETNRRVLGQLPETGRRTRRLYPPGSSLGNEWIEFDVYQLCGSLPPGGAIQAVWAIVTDTSCHSSVSIGNIVLVYDTRSPGRRGCWFDVPVELLAGMSGRADLAAGNNQTVLFCAEYRNLGDCYWKMSGFICCGEEAY